MSTLLFWMSDGIQYSSTQKVTVFCVCARVGWDIKNGDTSNRIHSTSIVEHTTLVVLMTLAVENT